MLFESPAFGQDTKVIVSLPDAGIPFFGFLLNQMEAEAHQIGGIALIAVDGQRSAQKQAADIESGIALGVPAFIIDAIDGNVMQSVIHEVTNAGGKVVLLERTIPQAQGVLAQVSADFVRGGELQAEGVLHDFPSGARVINLELDQRASEVDRSNGLQHILGPHQDRFELVNKAISIELLQSPPIDDGVLSGLGGKPIAIVCGSDLLAISVRHKLDQMGAGGTSAEVFGFEADRDGVAAVRSGQLAATVELFFGKQARQALQIVTAAVRSGTVPHDPNIKVQPVLITKSNVGEAEQR